MANPDSTELPAVAIVVLNYDGLQDSRACLQSLRALDWPGELETIVVDNGSPGGQAEALGQEFPEATHLPQQQNLGFTGGTNLAMERVLAQKHQRYVVLLNNDTEVEPDWLRQLVLRAEADPRCGIVTSLMLYHDRPELVENAGVVFLASGDAIPIGRGAPVEKHLRPKKVLGACGGAMLLRVSMLDEIGLFRQDFFANFEDVDLSLRAVVSGWEVVYEPKARVRHKLGRTIDKVRDKDFFMRSQRNLLWTLLVNLPWPVLLLDLPFLALREVLLCLICPLLGLRGISSSVFASRKQVFAERKQLLQARRQVQALKKRSSLVLMARQGYLLPRWWWPFFRDAVLRRRRSYMNQAAPQEDPAHG